MSSPTLCTVMVLALCSTVVSAANADIQGRITAADTGQGIEGAAVRVQGAAGVEVAGHTDGFGFYRLSGVAPGTYAFEATHPAFQPFLLEPLVLADGARAHQSATLVPLQAREGTVDIYVSVSCAATGYELGGVPVELTVSPTGALPAYRGRQLTDPRGLGRFLRVPKGFVAFAVNEGADRRPGWEGSSQQPTASLEADYWCQALLKPAGETLLVSVHGYDPVTQAADAPLERVYVIATGVHPADHAEELLPAQTGVSGIRKLEDAYWDNTLAGKVRFDGLPPIDWRIEGKRLGYRRAMQHVIANPQARLVPTALRLDMELLATRLTLVMDSPYHEPAMLAGLPVVLRGMTNSNTQGIERTNRVVFDAATTEATARFDRLLPGRYRIAVQDAVELEVPVLIEGQPLPQELPGGFRVRFAGTEVAEAVGDEETRVAVALTTEPVTLRGRLWLRDMDHHLNVEGHAGRLTYFEYPAANRRLEIRVSEYFQDHLPTNYHFVEVETDAEGVFAASVLPAPYGVAVPGLDGYWGFGAEVTETSRGDPAKVSRIPLLWPQYRRWPYSRSQLTDYSVLTVNSDCQTWVDLELWEDVVQAEQILHAPANDPTLRQVIALYREQDQLKFYLQWYYDFTEGGTLSLAQDGLVHRVGRRDDRSYLFEDVAPGSGYHFVFDHPRYRLRSADAQERFDVEDHNPPGEIRTNAPPRYGPTPMQYRYDSAALEYPGAGTAGFTILKWNTDANRYVTAASQRPPDYLKAEYAGQRVFRYSQATPVSAYEAWLDLTEFFDDDQEHWFAVADDGGDLEGTFFIGGPRAAESAPYARPPLRVAYDVRVLARNAHGRREFLDGVVVRFAEGGEATTGGEIVRGRTKSYDVRSATLAGWEYAPGQSAMLDTTGETPLITVTINMRQGYTLEGTVLDALTGRPIPGASIRLSQSQGQNGEALPPSAADGSFAYAHTLRSEVYFLDVRAPGYLPARQRLVPDGRFAYRLKDANAIGLQPLPPPQPLPHTASLDRFGAFLPGVKRAGNQHAFDAFRADDALTLTWRLAVRQPATTFTTLPGYDTASFQAGPDLNVETRDQLDSIWLMDQRVFRGDPDGDPPLDLALPPADAPHAQQEWLARILQNDTNTPNVFRQRLASFEPTDETNVVTAVGQLKLWQLPPGEFKPAFVAVTRQGAIAIHPFAYVGAYADKQLTGLRLPPWMATVADTLGVIAGAQDLASQVADLEEAMPPGRFFPLPRFTADIKLLDHGYLDYRYLLDVNLVEGAATPGQGLLGLALGTLGLNLSAGVEARVLGEPRQFYLQVRGGAGFEGREDAPPAQGTTDKPECRTPITRQTVHAPGLRPRLIPVTPSLDPHPQGELAHVTSHAFDPRGQPDELEVLHEVSGLVGGRLSADLVLALARVATAIPPLAVLMEGAQATGNLTVDAYLRGLVGLHSRTCWRTVFPHEFEHYTFLDPSARQRRRHFLGGDESAPCDGRRRWDLCFAFGAGLDLQVGRRLGGTAEFTLAGDDCPGISEPALLAEVNTNGYWPPIRRVSGNGTLNLKAYARLWRLKLGWEWQMELFTIDRQLGTETRFYLSQINRTVGDVRVEDFDPAIFVGVSPQVIRKFLPLGTYSLAAGNPDALAYVDMLEGRQDMALRFSTRSGPHAWSPPNLITHTAGAIVDAVLAPRPGQTGWLAVWSEIAPENVNDYYPPSVLRYSTCDLAAGPWTEPRELAALDLVAAELRLVPRNEGLALVFLADGEGARAENFEVHGTTWDGTSWSAPQLLVPATALSGFEVAGSADTSRVPLHVAYVTASGDVMMVAWDGELAPPPQRLAENAHHNLALAVGPDVHYLSWVGRNGGLNLSRYPAGGPQWLAAGSFYPEAHPAELQTVFLPHATEPVLMHVWTQGGGQAAVWFGCTTLQGEPLTPAANLTANSRGAYRHPEIVPGAGRQALLTTLFHHESVEELRAFELAYPPAAAAADRDQDGLPDLGELHVVDADPGDRFETIAHVAPDGDFDGDGFLDSEEMRLGSNPADPEDYPALQVLLEPGEARTAGAAWRLEGGEWLSGGRALCLRPGTYRVEFAEVPPWSTPRAHVVTVGRARPAGLIVRYLEGGVAFETWAASLLPPLPADRSRPADVNGPLGLANFAAYALGVHPQTLEHDALPTLTLVGSEVILTYQASKVARDAAYRVWRAPVLAAEAWRGTVGFDHVKVGETAVSEVWQLRMPIPSPAAQDFLRLEVMGAEPDR